MLIELNKDIVEMLKNKTLSEKEIDGLSNIAKAYRAQRHYVYGPYEIFELLSGLSEISESDRETYKRIYSRYMSFNELNSLSIKLNVQKNDITERIEKREEDIVFSVTLEEMGVKKFSLESNIISESLYDCEFYYWLAKFMMSKTGFLNEKTYLSYKKVHGAGDDIGNVIENEINDGKICLVIADSDKKFNEDTPGKTYNNAKNTTRRREDEFVGILDMINVREKENLLPPMLMKLTDSAKHCSDLLDDFECFYNNDISEEAYYYLDLKDGINGEQYCNNEKIKLYIDRIIENNDELKVINGVTRNRIVADTTEKIFYGISRQVEPVVKDVFMDKLRGKLEDKKKLFSEGKIPEEVISEYEERCTSIKCIFDEFSEKHKEEWFRIAKLVQNFCCAPNESLF